MKKIYLFCDQGMSTSMLAQKMHDIRSEHNLPLEVKAYSIKILEKIIDEENSDAKGL
jgi:PTS system cellobiose-specific IIB component